MTTSTIAFESADGLTLEGRLAFPDGAPVLGGAVLCHPHPQYAGSMSSSLVPALQRAFLAAGWASLRFNFRGVGRSEGSHDGGVGEVSDVLGALARIRDAVDGEDVPIAVVGWSFGALVGLNAVARDGRVGIYVGVAPPARRALSGKMALPAIADLDHWAARSLIVFGGEDPVCRRTDAEELARQLPPPVRVRVVPGADHMFTGFVDDLCAIVVDFATEG